MKIKSLTQSLVLSICGLIAVSQVSTGLSQERSTLAEQARKLAPSLLPSDDDDPDPAVLEMGKEFAKRVAAEQGIRSPEIVAGGLIEDPETGRSQFAFKVLDESGELTSMTLDRQGNLLSDEQPGPAAMAVKRGRIHQELSSTMEMADEGELMRVTLWCRTPENLPKPVRAEVRDQTSQPKDKPDRGRPGQPGLMLSPPRMPAEVEALVMSKTLAVAQRLEEMNVPCQPGKGGPLINAWMTKAEIESIATHPDVLECYLEATNAPSMSTSRRVVRAHTVNNRGITGNGVNVGVIEVGGRVNFSNPWLTGTQRLTNSCLNDHASRVAGVIGSRHDSERGIAPNARLYIAGSCRGWDNELQAATDAAITWGARVINNSWNQGAIGAPNPSRVPDGQSRYLDRLITDNYVTIVHSAGNSGGLTNNVVNPATAFSIITVGAFDDRGTVDTFDDRMAPFSGFLNPTSTFGDRVKPEVVAPGTNITSLRNASTWLSTASGTSYAAPAVAGTAALMMERDQQLTYWPETVKAILMATAWQNLEGAARLSSLDGAGGIQADRADDLTRGIRGSWVGQNYNHNSPTNFDVSQAYFVAGRRTRVVLCWNQDTNYTQYASQPAVDLDLQILRPNGTVRAGSYSRDNTYEIADFSPDVTGWHTIRIRRGRTSGTVNGFGAAWYQP